MLKGGGVPLPLCNCESGISIFDHVSGLVDSPRGVSIANFKNFIVQRDDITFCAGGLLSSSTCRSVNIVSDLEILIVGHSRPQTAE